MRRGEGEEGRRGGEEERREEMRTGGEEKEVRRHQRDCPGEHPRLPEKLPRQLRGPVEAHQQPPVRAVRHLGRWAGQQVGR